MRTQQKSAKERRPGRGAHPNENDELDRGLTAAIKRSNEAVADKIEELLREKYQIVTDPNA